MARRSRARTLTRAQVLAWRDEFWSYTDKQAIGQALDLLPVDRTEFYQEAGGRRVIATVDGDMAFVIRPGFVSWPQGVWGEGVDENLYSGGIKHDDGDGATWAELCTFRGSGWSTKRQRRDFGMCPNCGYALPATGGCDNCQ